MPTKYISQEDLEKFKTELQELKTVKRQGIAERIEEAKSLGDLSENAEYIEAREAQAFNEGRIRELEELVKNAVIIDENKQKTGARVVVEVGDTIEVKNEKGDKMVFTIVGSNGTDPSQNKISNESPLGRAFLSRIPGEDVEVITPLGKMRYKILAIK
ncbi:MAG: transcription elongation factor GreA [Candidatus Sungbacteria bacterium]|uniref:Transcription elongation factor GreA n=1 Tax=Candidatus Sungiibacteriota bacterium TaxID=2750080 RepID=A0A9D6DQF7_9BACT|nr:transcription elongation factor GreA [Candidatus Sungbacteria bacterium]